MYERKPWGYVLKLFWLPWVWLKFIHVKPGHQNSLHIHYKRNELVLKLPFHFFSVRKEEPHRLLSGNYLEFAYGRPEETDIKRLEDDYARV